MTNTAPIGSVLGGLSSAMTQGKPLNGVSTNNFAKALEDANQKKKAATAPSSGDTAVDKFLKYQQMTPGEKIRASFLSAHGLTEDDLKAMSPDDRQKIEDQIKEEIRKKLLSKTGGEGGQTDTSSPA